MLNYLWILPPYLHIELKFTFLKAWKEGAAIVVGQQKNLPGHGDALCHNIAIEG